MIKEKKTGAVLVDGLRLLLTPVGSSDADNHYDDKWAGRIPRRKPCLSAIVAGLFWWLMSVLLGLLISRLH